jgi:hypothetical protein
MQIRLNTSSVFNVTRQLKLKAGRCCKMATELYELGIFDVHQGEVIIKGLCRCSLGLGYAVDMHRI